MGGEVCRYSSGRVVTDHRNGQARLPRCDDDLPAVRGRRGALRLVSLSRAERIPYRLCNRLVSGRAGPAQHPKRIRLRGQGRRHVDPLTLQEVDQLRGDLRCIEGQDEAARRRIEEALNRDDGAAA